jgi:para-nitrobenzyl esterase
MIPNYSHSRFQFLPLIDGHLLTEQPLTTFRQGRHNQVPVIVGNTGLEAGYFALTRVLPVVTNQATFMSATTSLLGANAATVRAAYPVANDVAAREAFLTLLSDGAFVCRSRTLVRALAPNQASPVFRFHFTPELRGVQSLFGSFHTLELFFLFQTLDRYNYAPSSSELAISEAMQDLWGRFVATGDPNGGSGPRWPALSGQRDDTLELGGSFGVLTGLRGPQCDVWDSLSLYD